MLKLHYANLSYNFHTNIAQDFYLRTGDIMIFIWCGLIYENLTSMTIGWP